METKEFKRIVWNFFREKGFEKAGSYFVKVGEEIICVVGLQRSPFSSGYYINVGHIIAELNPSLAEYRDVDGDVRTWFCYGYPRKDKNLFEPEKITGKDLLLEWLSENYDEVIKGTSSIAGLKEMLQRNPALLNVTKLTAKRYLGYE